LLAENFLGQLHTIRLQSFNGNYLNPNAPAHWRQRIEISGLNVIVAWDLRRSAASAGSAISMDCSRAAKILYPDREGYNVIIPDSLYQCFATSRTALKECSNLVVSHAHATGDRPGSYGARPGPWFTISLPM